MGRTGAACLGLGSGSRQGSLQVTLNVGDWGDHAKWPRCPSPGPLKPNGICHKSGSRGTWEAQPRELQSRQAEGHRPCSGNKPCASAKRCCLSIGLGLQKWASAAWRHTGTRNCSEISLWTCGERTVEKSLAPAQWASQGAWVAGRACLPAHREGPSVPRFSHGRTEGVLLHLQGPPSSGSEERASMCPPACKPSAKRFLSLPPLLPYKCPTGRCFFAEVQMP